VQVEPHREAECGRQITDMAAATASAAPKASQYRFREYVMSSSHV